MNQGHLGDIQIPQQGNKDPSQLLTVKKVEAFVIQMKQLLKLQSHAMSCVQHVLQQRRPLLNQVLKSRVTEAVLSNFASDHAAWPVFLNKPYLDVLDIGRDAAAAA